VWPSSWSGLHDAAAPERDGLAQSDDIEEDERQKNYRITEKGGEELSRCFARRPILSEPPRDELVIKVLVASRLANVDVYEVIQLHRRYIVQLMQQWTRLKEMNLTSTSPSRWRWTPNSSDWTPSCVGSTAPTVDFIERPLSRHPRTSRTAEHSPKDWNPR